MRVPRSQQIEQIAWAASTLKTRDIPLSVYSGLLLKLDLLATTTGTPALTREEMAKAITKLSLTLNGQDTIIGIPGYHLFFENFYDYAKEPAYSFDLGAAGANKVMQMTLILSFALPRSVSPEDTILDLRSSAGINTAVLEVQWAAAAISATTTITSGNLEIYSLEYANVDASLKVARREMSHGQSLLAATGSQETKLDVGGTNQYQRLFLYAKDNAGALSNAQLDNLKVKARSFTFMDVASAVVQDKNALLYSIAAQTGVYVVDFTRFGKMTQRLDARKLSELILEANSLVANGTLDVVKEKAIYA